MSYLSYEFFEEVRKKDESFLTDHFGGPIGRLLFRHAMIEGKYVDLASQLEGGGSVPGEEEDNAETEEFRNI